MNVQYWAVGATEPTTLPITLADFSSYLISDWVPSMPASLGPVFFGWPAYLIEAFQQDGPPLWSLQERLRGTERQWKGVLSWMLGVAGARHVLASEGYQWIAPLSAFYHGRKEVTLHDWHLDFPQSLLYADRDPTNKARLRPDYLAVRSLSDGLGSEWAAVEAKGTDSPIANVSTCRADWRDQAHNVTVKFNGQPMSIARHMVVATRSNPNARRPKTRCLQIRAWNSTVHEQIRPPLSATLEIAAAQFFGLCRNLHLQDNARAIALATQSRLTAHQTGNSARRHEDLHEILPRAEVELRGIAGSEAAEKEALPPGRVDLRTDFGNVEVRLQSETMSLIRALGMAESSEEGVEALVNIGTQLSKRMRVDQSRPKDPAIARLAYGIEVRIPEQLAYRENRR